MNDDDGKQTDTSVKNIFSHLENEKNYKTSKFNENLKNHFSHKTNIFSYDENDKIKIIMNINKRLKNNIYSKKYRTHSWKKKKKNRLFPYFFYL